VNDADEQNDAVDRPEADHEDHGNNGRDDDDDDDDDHLSINAKVDQEDEDRLDYEVEAAGSDF
jgi:hypothetical protein